MKEVTTAILLLIGLWAIMWGGCAMSEECYQNNINYNYNDIQTN